MIISLRASPTCGQQLVSSVLVLSSIVVNRYDNHDRNNDKCDCPCHRLGEIQSEGNSSPLWDEEPRLVWVVVENQKLPMLWVCISMHKASCYFFLRGPLPSFGG
jgi:hypothetical protein